MGIAGRRNDRADQTIDQAAFDVTCYRDVEGDSYGDHFDPGTVDPDGICDPGTVADNSDCDDASAETYPGAAANELFGGCTRDADRDGYGDDSITAPVEPGSDRDDSDTDVNPGAPGWSAPG